MLSRYFVQDGGIEIMKDYSKSKFRQWLNNRLTKIHRKYKIVDDRIYQIEYHHSYFIAYYEKPTLKGLIQCLKANHYQVWECLSGYDIKNNRGSRIEINSGMFPGFFNLKRRAVASKVLDMRSGYWERNVIARELEREKNNGR